MILYRNLQSLRENVSLLCITLKSAVDLNMGWRTTKRHIHCSNEDLRV